MSRPPLLMKSAHRWGLVSVLALLSACGEGREGARSPNASKRGAQGIVTERGELTPQSEPVELYGQPVEQDLSEVEKEILSRLEAEGFEHRPALSQMIHNLSAVATREFDLVPALQHALLTWSGIVHPSPRWMKVEFEVPGGQADCTTEVSPVCRAEIDELVAEVRATPKEAGALGVGVGVVQLPNGQTRMLLGWLAELVELEPIPVEAKVGQKVTLEGRLTAGHQNPRVVLVIGDRESADLPVVAGDDGSIRAQFACDRGKGRYQVELLADGDYGPEVLANFPVFCGVKRPRKIEFQYEQVSSEVAIDDIVRANLQHLNDARRERGLPELRWNTDAARVARAHSQDMALHGYIGHVSPTTGDVGDRFRKEGLEHLVLLENVARGYGPLGIHEDLMRSPGHRANLLAKDVTHVGIGAVFGEQEPSAADAPRPVFLTQNFYAELTPPPRDLVGAVRKGMEKLRRDSKLVPFEWDPKIASLAQRHADSLAKGKGGLSDDELRDRLQKLGYRHIDRREVTTDHWEALLDVAFLREDAKLRGGLGVARRSKEQGGGFVMVVYAESQ